MTGWWVGSLALALPMAAEWWRSRTNERHLRAAGATEVPGDVYRVMAVAYPLAFASMAGEGWLGGLPGAGWMAAGGVVFLLGKGLKYWAIARLGSRWTFRVLVLPRHPVERGGPYRWVNHPNYLGVCGELVGAWWWFGAWWTGPFASAMFLILMWRRVRMEDRALRPVPHRAGPPS